MLGNVFVVENGSKVAEEATLAFKDRLPIKYCHFEEGNKSKALNQLLSELNPELPSLYLDDDVLVPPGLLKQYAVALEKYGPLHYYGGPTTVRYEVMPDPKLVPYMPVSNRGFRLEFSEATEVDNQYFLGCNWMCYPNVVIAAGGFDPAVGPGAGGGARGQETDMQHRLYENGSTAIYVPGEPVSHWVPRKAVEISWVLERLEKTNILRGRQNASPLRKIYWLVMREWYRLFQWLSLSNKCRYRIYKGLTRGNIDK